MRHPLVLFILLNSGIVTAHRFLLPKSLLFEKEEGEYAVIEDEHKMGTIMIFNINFSSMGIAESDAWTLYKAYCATVADDGNEKWDLSKWKMAGMVHNVVAGRTIFPVGGNATLSLKSAIEIQLDEDIAFLQARSMLQTFGGDVDSLFYRGELEGIFLHKITPYIFDRMGFTSIFEMRAGVRARVKGCEGDSIVVMAYHADPNLTIHGTLYKVADPGVIENGLYIHNVLPREIFISDNNEEISVSNCRPSFGGKKICSRAVNPVNECSILHYKPDQCRRIVHNMDKTPTVVRGFGKFHIIATDKLTCRIVNAKRNRTKFIWGGIALVKVAVNDVIHLDGMELRGWANSTDISDVPASAVRDHVFPFGMDFETIGGGGVVIPSQAKVKADRLARFTTIGLISACFILVVLLVVGACVSRNLKDKRMIMAPM